MALSRKNMIELYSLIAFHYKEINLDKLRHLNHMELMILLKPLGKRICENLGVPYGEKNDENSNENEVDDDYPTEFKSMNFDSKKPPVSQYQGTKEDFINFYSQFTDVVDNT